MEAPIRDSEEDLSRMKPLITIMRKQWDNGWAVIVISIGNRCFVKEDSYEKVTPVCRVISAKTLRMG
eukprot:2418907-Prorocentrum_lima.AAC.1